MRNWLEYLPFVAITSIVRLLPRNAALCLGGGLGTLAKRLLPGRVRISAENLQHAIPDIPAAEVSSTIDKMFVNLGKNSVEMLRLDKYTGAEDLANDFNISGTDFIKEALQLERGCIILTGHVGFWEAGTFFMPHLGFTTGVVAKPMRNPLVDSYFRRMRTASGSYIINSRKGARGILKALQSNHCVGILLDQHIKGHGSVAAPFFGKPAHTTTIITQMALRYRIPIISCFVYRQEDNSYRCEFSRMILLDGETDDKNILEKTAYLNRIIEDGVRRETSQWFWLHRRWRPCCENE